MTESQAEIVKVFDNVNKVRAVCFSPNEKEICSVGIDKKVKIWDVGKKCKIREFSRHNIESSYCANYSKNGELIATGGSDNKIRIWNTKSANGDCFELTGLTGSVYGVHFLKSSPHLISGSSDKTICYWDLIKQRQISSIRARGHVFCLSVTSDENMIGAGNTIRRTYSCSFQLFDLRSKEMIHNFYGKWRTVFSLDFDPSCSYIATGSADTWDAHLKIFDIRKLKLFQKYKHHSSTVRGLSYHPNGKKLLSGSAGGIKIFSITKHKEVLNIENEKRFGDQSHYSVCFSPSGKFFASGTGDGKVNLWRSPFPVVSNIMDTVKQDEHERIQFLIGSHESEEVDQDSDVIRLIFWGKISFSFSKLFLLM